MTNPPFPIAPDDAAPARPVMLLVDDEKVFIGLARLALSGRFEVRVATCAREALVIAEDPNIRLLLSDFQMEDMNGVDLIRQVRARRPDLPCILFSGNLNHESWAAAHNAGCRHVLPKPLALHAVIEICSRLITPPKEPAVSVEGQDFLESVLWEGKLGRNLRTLNEHLRKDSGPVFLHTPGGAFPSELLHGLLPSLHIYPGPDTPPPPQPLFTDLQGLDLAGHARLAQLFPSRREFPWMLSAKETPDELLEKGLLSETIYFRLGAGFITLPPPSDHPGDSLHLCNWWLSTLSPAAKLSSQARAWLASQLEPWDWVTLLALLREAAPKCRDGAIDAPQLQQAMLALSLGSQLSEIKAYAEFSAEHVRKLEAAWHILDHDPIA